MQVKHSELMQQLRSSLMRYVARWPEESERTAPFLALLDDPEDPFVRERLAGHFTGSAWLVDRAGRAVLLTHHRKLDRWLQLGGHADGDPDLAQVALREAEEESGLIGLSIEPEVFDVDCHWIPERKQVPGHWHYDLRFVVRTGESEEYAVSEESLDLAWRDIASIVDDSGFDESMRRMARKWLMRDGARA